MLCTVNVIAHAHIFHKYDLYFIRDILTISINLLLFLNFEKVHNKQPVSQFTEVNKCLLWCDSP